MPRGPVPAGSAARYPFSHVRLSFPGCSSATAASPLAAVSSLAAGSPTDTPPPPPFPELSGEDLPPADPPWLRLMSAEALSAPPVQILQLEARPLNVPLHAPFAIASATLSAIPNVAIRAVLRMPGAGGKGDSGEEKGESGSREAVEWGREGGAGTEEKGGSGGVIEAVGWGEAPVLPSVTEEDQETILKACVRARDWVVSQPPMRWPELLLLLERVVLPGHGLASARAGVEMAVLDALAVALAVPLWRLFSPSCRPLSTDITIPICSPASAASLARSYSSRGFSCFKIKLGALPPADSAEEHLLQEHLVEERVGTVTTILEGQGRDETEGGRMERETQEWVAAEGGGMEEWEGRLVEADVARVVAVHAARPRCCLLLDANGGYRTAAAVLHMLSALAGHGIHPDVLEQPFHRSNWRAMRALTAALSPGFTPATTSPHPAHAPAHSVLPAIASFLAVSSPAAAEPATATTASSFPPSSTHAHAPARAPSQAPAPNHLHAPASHPLPSSQHPPITLAAAAAAAAAVPLPVPAPAPVVVMADESCRGEEDVWRIVREGAGTGVNVKLAKTGVLGALRVVAAVLQANRAAAAAAAAAATGGGRAGAGSTECGCARAIRGDSSEARPRGEWQEAGARGRGCGGDISIGGEGGGMVGEGHGPGGNGSGGRWQLMVGGMVETRIAMGFAAHMAAGLGCFQWVDLDTPLLLADDPVSGGYTMDEDRIIFPPGLGHGGSLDWPSQAPL
ncbi:hypothetical protein CLOM_g5499 [Closterium sp. NIES-68]|nr:hypothetical protein CLOM_g5499 [Closterium sp. NIES-68]GJP69346.1 hypothetical protein CLOP_g284 [Closterium sp. NIES-67]